MCELHTHTDLISTYARTNTFDPTRTLTLRAAWVADMNRRFRDLIRVIIESVATNNAFGITSEPRITSEPFITFALTAAGPGEFDFPRTADKMDAFMKWLRLQESKGLLELKEMPRIGAAIEQPWTNIYIQDSYKRGVIRARHELIKAGYPVPTIEASGGIEAVLASPFHVDRLGVLYTRTFQELEGITAAMDNQISNILAQGLADGDNPNVLARKLVATINGKGADKLGIRDSLGRFIPAQRRAQTLARTETIRAHHKANIQEYKNWQAAGVSILAEWVTAGDNRVCPECEAGEAGSPYTLDQAEGMIPAHPNCFIDPQVPIYTSEGWKPIGKIKVGDLVLTHKYRFRKVTQLIHTPKQQPEVVRFRFHEKRERILITSNHPMRAAFDYKWKEAGEFKRGSAICGFEKKKPTIYTIKSIKRWTLKKPRTLYNFSVEEDESYIAKGVVVHNCRCIAIPIPNPKRN